jgi:hypothetical protein
MKGEPYVLKFTAKDIWREVKQLLFKYGDVRPIEACIILSPNDFGFIYRETVRGPVTDWHTAVTIMPEGGYTIFGYKVYRALNMPDGEFKVAVF